MMCQKRPMSHVSKETYVSCVKRDLCLMCQGITMPSGVTCGTHHHAHPHHPACAFNSELDQRLYEAVTRGGMRCGVADILRGLYRLPVARGANLCPRWAARSDKKVELEACTLLVYSPRVRFVQGQGLYEGRKYMRWTQDTLLALLRHTFVYY
jgi:hypothetical protein